MLLPIHTIPDENEADVDGIMVTTPLKPYKIIQLTNIKQCDKMYVSQIYY